MAPTLVCTWEEVFDAPIGTYVELRGTLQAQRAERSPTTGEPVAGFHVLCSLFTKSGGIGVPDFARREDVVRWSDAVFTSPDGARTMSVALADGPVRVPAAEEDTLSGEPMTKLLERLQIADEAVVQVQVLERSIPDGAPVRIRGVIADITPSGSAFRASARARRGLVGERGRPIVIL